MDVLSFAVGVGLASIIPVVVLWMQSRAVPMYAGPGLWTLGMALIASSRLLTLGRAEPWIEGPAALLTLVAMAIGVSFILEGLLRFQGRTGSRPAYAVFSLAVLVLATIGTLVEGSLAWYQVLASTIWMVAGVGAVGILRSPITRPYASAARLLMVALGGFALFHLVRVPFVLGGAMSPDDAYAASGWSIATQALTMIVLLLVAFGLVLMTGQRLAADLVGSRDALADANQGLESRVHERTAQLEDANRELSAFSATISHDLKAPLRAINGFAAMLLRDDSDRLDARGQERLEAIVGSSARMARLIEELLEHARLGSRPVRRVAVPLQPLIRAAVERGVARVGARAEQLTIAVEPVEVVGDPELVALILDRLIENALVFHAPGVAARVRVSGVAENDRVTIGVADEGIGVPAEHHERIFEVFTRLNPEDAYPGTGMGLAMARRAAHLLGTDVLVDSAPGAGSRFTMALPLAPAAPVPPAGSSAS